MSERRLSVYEWVMIVIVFGLLAIFVCCGCNQRIIDQKEYVIFKNPTSGQLEPHLIRHNHYGQTNVCYWVGLFKGNVVMDPNGVTAGAESLVEKAQPEAIEAAGKAVGTAAGAMIKEAAN